MIIGGQCDSAHRFTKDINVIAHMYGELHSHCGIRDKSIGMQLVRLCVTENASGHFLNCAIE